MQGRDVLTVMIFFSGLIGSSSFEAFRLFPRVTVSGISALGGIVNVALPSSKTWSSESAPICRFEGTLKLQRVRASASFQVVLLAQ